MNAATQKSILFIGAFPRPAALERFVSGDLAYRLKGLGWKVFVTARHPNRLARFGLLLLETWRHAPRCDMACVDVFSGAAFVWAELACALLRRAGKPYVLTLHGGNLPDFAKRKPARVKRLLVSAAAVTCPSAYLATEMRLFRPDLRLIPNGFDLSKYPFRESRPVLRNLVWLRAFHQIYNPMMAPAVLARLRVNMPQARLTMVGPGKGDGSYAATRKIATQLGLLNHIKFTGSIPKEAVTQILGEHDIFLNTTNVDNTPVSVIEALACGLPVVSTNVGGLPYLLEDGKTALLVPLGNVDEMAAAVTRLVADPNLAGQLGANGRKLAESFDWSVVLPQWQRLFNSVMPAPPLANALGLS